MGRKIGKIAVILGMIFFLNNLSSQAEEIPKPYQVKCEKPNGENGYYTEAPDIEIEHFDEKLVTRYKMIFPDGKELSGKLNKEENQIVIDQGLFLEGEHRLELWMEDEEGVKVDGTETEKEYKIDRVKPEDPLEYVYQKEEEEERICFSSETSIEIKATDRESGIWGVYYQLNEGKEEFLEGGEVTIPIPIGFEGSITAYAVDHAGNKGEKFKSKKIVCENKAPEIIMNAPQGFERWYNHPFTVEIKLCEKDVKSGIKKTVCYVNEEKVLDETCEERTDEKMFSLPVNAMSEIIVETEDYAGNKSVRREKVLFDNRSPQIEISGADNYAITGENVSLLCEVSDDYRVAEVSGKVLQKSPQGIEKIEEIKNWEKDGEEYYVVQELNEDGIYQVRLHAEDQAGNESEEQWQIIIDKGNPVISKIEQFQGKYVPFFEWNYEPEEIIQDFTTYIYEVNLDNRICVPNLRYQKEGKHILEVTAKDAAGNRSEAKAEFVIDHTAPEIIIQNVEQGKIYQTEVEASIMTKNKEDKMKNIYVDEIQQSWNQGNGVFQYLFREPGKHRIKVEASDWAGNRAEKEIQFTIEEKRTLFEKIIHGNRIREIKKEGENVKREKKSLEKWYIIGGICLVGSIGIVRNRKRRRKK